MVRKISLWVLLIPSLRGFGNMADVLVSIAYTLFLSLEIWRRRGRIWTVWFLLTLLVCHRKWSRGRRSLRRLCSARKRLWLRLLPSPHSQVFDARAGSSTQQTTGNTFEPELDLFLRFVPGNDHVTPNIRG